MPHHDRVHLRDIRTAVKLIDDCARCGFEAHDWQVCLIEGLRSLLPAQVGISGNMKGFGRGDAQSISSVRLGWPDAQSEQIWVEYAQTMPVERTPEYPALAKPTAQHQVVTRSRNQLWGSPQAWYRSKTFLERHKQVGIDDYILSLCRVGQDELWHSIWMHRALGAQPFGRREWWLIHWIHKHIGSRIGTVLAAADEPSPKAMTRRQREIFAGLLRGLSDKELASELGIARATAHEHVLAVYRYFSVGSRSELMARFMGRQLPREQ